MVDRESLQEKYATLNTADLLEITSNKPNYTELAVAVALEELKKRNIPEVEIKSYISVLAYKPDQKTIDKYFVDLNIFQKLLNYSVIIPLIKRRFRSSDDVSFLMDGYLLKDQQANYYVVAGVIFAIIGAILSNVYNSSFLIVWLSGLVISFLSDIGYNKN